MISLLILTCDMSMDSKLENTHTHIHIQEVSVFLRKTTEKELLIYLECSG